MSTRPIFIEIAVTTLKDDLKFIYKCRFTLSPDLSGNLNDTVVSRMDITNFDSNDINVFLARAQIETLRAINNAKRLLIRTFLGGVNSEQSIPLERAYIRVPNIYKKQGINLILQTFSNDMVRTKYHWTCA